MARPHLLLVGGGHAHVLVLESLIAQPADAEVTVIVDRRIAIYSGMVPGYVAGQYRVEDLQIDVEALADRAGARTIIAPVTRIEPHAGGGGRIVARDAEACSYDLASIDIGSTVAQYWFGPERNVELLRRTPSISSNVL